ncbi:MAG TPA: hypothetical protein VGC72_07420 [Candidatus Elarobacter sp.]
MDQQQPENRPPNAPIVPNIDLAKPAYDTPQQQWQQPDVSAQQPQAPWQQPQQPPPWQQPQPPPHQQPYPQPPPPYGYQPQPIYITQQVQTASAGVAAAPPKSMAVALLLTFFFGPLGLFYVSVTGGIVMLIVSFIVAIVTLGFGLFITGPICMVWAAIATNTRNEQARIGAQHFTQNSR